MSINFDQALYGIAPEIRGYLENLSPETKKTVNEIRLRKNAPLSVTVKGETKFVSRNSGLSDFSNQNVVRVPEKALDESFRLLCGGSVFAHEKELARGFITLKNGCRCGVGGIYGQAGPVKVTSLNLRIARQIEGAAKDILKGYLFGGLLIAGPPASGKTTVLRDLIRSLSYGDALGSRRIAVIDSRGELFSDGLDLGPNTDVINISNKALGAQMAVRTLFPQILAFDEIGTEAELSSISQCFFAGVSVITTAHVGSLEELFLRGITKKLLESGVVSQVALLPPYLGGKIKLFSAKEILNRD